jgi:hypothetical protein
VCSSDLSSPGFQLAQTFFGFKPEDRVKLHESLFDLIWYGSGRWDWNTLYNMPVYIRRFWISKINKMQDDAAAAREKVKTKTKKPTIIKSPL